MSLLLLFQPKVVTADAVQYVTPRTVLLGSAPTLSPSVLTGSGNVAETGLGADSLLSANLQVNATTGDITAIDGSGATPVGSYSFELARNAGTAFELVVNVVLGGGNGDGAAFQASALQTSSLADPIQRSALG